MCSLISRPTSLQILPSLSECDQLAIIRASIMRFCFILSIVLILLLTFTVDNMDCLPAIDNDVTRCGQDEIWYPLLGRCISIYDHDLYDYY